MVLLIVPHHAALTYSHVGKGYIYTEEPVKSLFYLVQSDFLNLWFMILLFFISGVSASFSISKRNYGGFVKERIKKLFIPVCFYTWILGPLTAYYSQRTMTNAQFTLGEFYLLYIKNIQEYLGWAQMWFCAYLFTFSIIALPLFKYLTHQNRGIDSINNFLMKKYNLFLPMIFIIIAEIALRPYYPGYQNLVNDWANFTVYFTFFMLGYIMGQNRKTFDKIQQFYRHFLSLSIISTLLYIILNQTEILPHPYKIYLLPLLKGISEYSLIMVILTISKKLLNVNNRWLKILSESSFGLYIFHFFFVTFFNIYLMQLNFHHYIKYIITICLTYIAYYLFYRLVIVKVKPLRHLCGVRS